MPTRIPVLAACLLLIVSVLGAEDQPKPETPKAAPPAKEQVEAWIKDLSSEEFQTRDTAEKKLVAAGETIIPVLKETIDKTEDAETRQRCERVINELSAGPRIAQAIKDLGDPKWETARKAVDTLITEWGRNHGAEKALADAAKSGGLKGQLAQIISSSQDNIRQQKEMYARAAEENPAQAENLRNAEQQVEVWTRRNILQTCENTHRQSARK